MKHFISGMVLALALVAALVMGMVAMAENAESAAPEAPALEQTEQTEQTAPAGQAADDAALQEAMQAYREAKDAARQEDLEAELKGYVEAGKLTQAQADLILNSCKERQALRNGQCPGCGYAFQSGMGGRMNGGRGGKGGRMNGGFGGMNNGFGGRGNRQQPADGQPQGDGAPAQPNADGI